MSRITNINVSMDSDVKFFEPNDETINVLLESEKLLADPNIKRYSLEDTLKELKRDC